MDVAPYICIYGNGLVQLAAQTFSNLNQNEDEGESDW